MARAKTIVWGTLACVSRVVAPACLIAMALSAATGCSSFQTICSTEWMKSPWSESEPPQNVSHVLAHWEKDVRTTTNSQAGGAPLVGLAGRVYLMSDSLGQGVDAHGELLVQLLDMTFVGPNSPPQKILEVRYDPIALKQLKRKDMAGDGYTLFLPWENYNPAVKKIQVQVAYQPRTGTPHYGNPVVVSLQTDQPQPHFTQQNIVPAAHYQPGPAGASNARK